MSVSWCIQVLIADSGAQRSTTAHDLSVVITFPSQVWLAYCCCCYCCFCCCCCRCHCCCWCCWCCCWYCWCLVLLQWFFNSFLKGYWFLREMLIMGLSKSTYHEIVDGIIKISGLPEGVFVLCQNGCAIDRSLSLRSADFANSKKCCEDVCGGPILTKSCATLVSHRGSRGKRWFEDGRLDAELSSSTWRLTQIVIAVLYGGSAVSDTKAVHPGSSCASLCRRAEKPPAKLYLNLVAKSC